MSNQEVLTRLESLCELLIAACKGGAGLSSASVGREREAFIDYVLTNVIGPPFRVGTGDITDASGNKSGQVDIVIEYGGSISFPLLRSDSVRLYLAEGVCAAIEVKSDITRNWNDVVKKANDISKLKRTMGELIKVGNRTPQYVPFFAVGYKGWKTKKEIANKLRETEGICGILVLDNENNEPYYCGRSPDYSDHTFAGAAALYGFLLSIEQLTSSMIAAKPSYRSYVT